MRKQNAKNPIPRPLGRPKNFVEDAVVSVRIDKRQYDVVKEFAAVESSYTGRQVTIAELIRMAVHFTFEDNERLRECFRRSRGHIQKRWDKKFR
jgi:hypothetical protein